MALGACNREPTPRDRPSPTEPAASPAARESQRDRAQAAAAERFIAAAEHLAYVEGWMWPHGSEPLVTPPLGTGHHNELREAFVAAKRERRGIDPDRVDDTQRLALAAYDHLLRRVDDRLDGHVPERSDATWYLRQLDPWRAALRERVLAGAGSTCTAFLEQLATRFDDVPRQLGAADPAHLPLAAGEFDNAATELRRLLTFVDDPAAQAAVARTIQQATATATRLREMVSAVEHAPRIARDRVQRLDPKPTPRRLDAPWREPELIRRARARLGVLASADDLFNRAQRAVLRYEAMAARQTQPPAAPTGKLDAVCETTWQRVSEWISQRDDDVLADPHCAPWVRWHANTDSTAKTTTDLRRDVLVAAWVHPNRARRLDAGYAAAAVTASDNQWLVDHTRTLALAIALPAPDVVELELRSGHEAACTAVAAVAVHGRPEATHDAPPDQGERDKAREIDAWLHDHCGWREPDERRHHVAADPDAMWRGLALAELLVEPARMHALDDSPWLTIGTLAVRLDASPTTREATSSAPPKPGEAPPRLQVHVEDL